MKVKVILIIFIVLCTSSFFFACSSVDIKYVQADKYVSVIETDMGNWMLIMSGRQDVDYGFNCCNSR